jgi:hypothetical protein
VPSKPLSWYLVDILHFCLSNSALIIAAIYIRYTSMWSNVTWYTTNKSTMEIDPR